MNPFSLESDQYARFRPTYPTELINLIVSLAPQKFIAWDVACGNGQLTIELSNHFETVIATDVSEEQITMAPQKRNINYRVEPSENTSIEQSSIDLITVSQAIHWFEFDQFYNQVRKVIKPNGILALIAYILPTITPEIDAVIQEFYNGTLNGYWDERRKFIEEEYTTIPFPFEEVKLPSYYIEQQWKREDLIGYLSTWSAVKKYKQITSTDPIAIVAEIINSLWGENEIIEVRTPLITKIARIK